MSRIFLPLLLVILFCGVACNYVTYTPRSSKNKQKEKPSIVLYERIIDFRIENNSWPVSKEDFISKGRKYSEVLKGFPYTTLLFKIKDSNHMVFTYMDHVKDVENFKQTEKIDLNSYQGTVKFFKENNRFIWKIN